MKKCSKCKLELPREKFYLRCKSKEDLDNVCIECRKQYNSEYQNKLKFLKWRLNGLSIDQIKEVFKSIPNITFEQYKSIYQNQNKSCYFCKEPQSILEIIYIDKAKLNVLVCNECYVSIKKR